MPTVLTISRNFPPVGSVGSSIRLVKTIKYLTGAGWIFYILTQDPVSPVVIEKEKSEGLEPEIPPLTKVIRKPSGMTISDNIPNSSILRYIAGFIWGVDILFEGYRQIKRNKIDLIYAAVPNIVNGVIAAILSRLTRIPLVIDVKDDIVGGIFYLNRSKYQQAVERGLEKYFINASKQVVFVTNKSLEVYQQRYPKKCSDFSYIPNGCDLDEFLTPARDSEIMNDGRFVILTAVSHYRRDHRDAEPFLKSLALFLSQTPEAVNKIRVIFLGDSLGEEYQNTILELGLAGIVVNIPTVNREVYRSWLSRADVLFLVQPYNNITSTSGTIYEYWATAKAPILLISEGGTSREIVEQNNIGRGFHFSDTSGIANYIHNIYKANESGNPIRITLDGIEVYDRRKIAFQMDEVWKKCIKQYKNIQSHHKNFSPTILGVRIDQISLDEILERIILGISGRGKIVISNVNIHALNLSYTLPSFRDFLNHSDIVFCDGVGVQLGARLLGQRLDHRFTPPDWLGKLASLCVEHSYTLYFLGSKPGVAEKAAAKLHQQHPALIIAGCHHGYFDKTPGSIENEAVVAEINRLSPDILVVGFGMPLQEQWLADNLQRLSVHVALPVGAAFDYVSGEIRRAPRWMTDHGLEWLGRLVIEPGRLWRRYIIGIPVFFWRILLQRLGLLKLPESN